MKSRVWENNAMAEIKVVGGVILVIGGMIMVIATATPGNYGAAIGGTAGVVGLGMLLLVGRVAIDIEARAIESSSGLWPFVSRRQHAIPAGATIQFDGYRGRFGRTYLAFLQLPDGPRIALSQGEDEKILREVVDLAERLTIPVSTTPRMEKVTPEWLLPKLTPQIGPGRHDQ